MCYDGDACEVWVEKPRRARKSHRCDECEGDISPGTLYIHVSYISDGSPGEVHWHFECRVLWGTVHEDLCGGEGMITAGGLREEFGEYGVSLSKTEDELLAYWGGKVPDEVARAMPYRRRFEEIQAKYRSAPPEGSRDR